MQLIKKSTKDNLLVLIDGTNAVWAPIPPCSKKCPIYSTCSMSGQEDICSIRKYYLNSVYKSLAKLIKDGDTAANHKINTFLMPLYQTLITTKITLHAVPDMFIEGKINPIYKQLRETIKLINHILNELTPQAKGKLKSANGEDNFLNGDSSYYENLVSSGMMPVAPPGRGDDDDE